MSDGNTNVSAANGTAERCRAEFRCRAAGAGRVYLVGSFNDWDPTATPMAGAADGEWTVVLELPPGFYHYKFVVDGRWCCEHGQTHQASGCGACGCSGDRCVPNAHGTMNRVKVVG